MTVPTPLPAPAISPQEWEQRFHARSEELLAPLLKLDKTSLYEAIMTLGSQQKPLPPEKRTAALRVHGCQSETFFLCSLENDLLHFAYASDALISAGLAALLAKTYEGFPPSLLFRHLPPFVEHLELTSLLSPTRSQGLASMLRHMRQQILLTASKN